jgi:ABC-type uncharacterized transport system permease subunit
MAAFISGISLTCFAASYGVAWALEVSQVYLRRVARRVAMLGFVVAGLLAHTLYLGYRVVEQQTSPLSSTFDWCLVAAWLLIVAYLYLEFYHPKAALGLYMLPLALVLVAAAALADRTPFAAGPASQVWGAMHGIALLLGTLAVMVGFAAGLMYLVQAARLKRKLPVTSTFRLPSLEWLERVNSRAIVVSALMVGVGFVAGIILNILGRDRSQALPWSDPVIGSSALMLAWLLAAAIFNGFYRPARRGRKVAYLTIVSFVFLVIALAVFVFVDTGHSGQKPATAALDRAVRMGGRS